MPAWFEAEVAELERQTRRLRGRRNVVLFYGSSSFTLWHDLAAYFPGYEVANLGFGGSTLADCVEYFDRLVVPLEPCVLVVYAGDNDLADGSSPEAVLDHLGAIIRRKRASLGAIPMAYVSIKISPARFFIMHKIAYTNRIIERALAAEDEVEYVDITRRMIGRGIAPLLEYYSADPLHMNRDGYRVLGKSLADYLAAVEQDTGDLRVRPAECEPAWVLPADDADEDEIAA